MNFNFQQDILLENERVLLEPLAQVHVELLTPIVLKDKDLLRYSPPRFGTPELLQAYIDDNTALRKRALKYPFAIFDKKLGRYAGSTSFLNISTRDRRLEIGSTWIGTDFQRTGLNRHSKFLLMDYVFEILQVERLEFKTDGRNKQSQQAIEAIGGKYEGILRSHTVMSDGFRRDTVYYSVLRHEWPSIKATVFSSISK